MDNDMTHTNCSTLVLGTADWAQPIATNQHYVVREIAQSMPVTFTESLGLRTPEWKMRDIRRIAKRIRTKKAAAHNTSRPIPTSANVLSPRVVPRHTGLAAYLNQRLIHHLVRDWIRHEGPRVLWTYSPVTYDLEREATVVVYHCVDLLGEIDRIPRRLIHAFERHLSNHAHVAIGTSPTVVAHLEERGFTDVRLWPNVADTDVVQEMRPSLATRVPDRVVFAGNLTTAKVDFQLLGAIAEAGMDLHLAGPVAQGGGSADAELAQLLALGATYHGILSPRDLAALCWSAQVGVIPYLINSYTTGVSPLKTHEYLASGLGVVSTPVPSVERVPGHVVVTDSTASFVEAVREMATGGARANEDERIVIAKDHSWSRRGDEIRSLLEELT